MRIKLQSNCLTALVFFSSYRYAFSGSAGDTSAEFEKDDYTLTLIKPSPIPSHEVKNLSESRPLQADKEESDKDLEEDKRE